MLTLLTQLVDAVRPFSRRVPHRARPGLESLDTRDVPSTFAAPIVAASAFHSYPPNPIMPQMSQASHSAFHSYPPQPVMPQVSQVSVSALHHSPPSPV